MQAPYTWGSPEDRENEDYHLDEYSYTVADAASGAIQLGIIDRGNIVRGGAPTWENADTLSAATSIYMLVKNLPQKSVPVDCRIRARLHVSSLPWSLYVMNGYQPPSYGPDQGVQPIATAIAEASMVVEGSAGYASVSDVFASAGISAFVLPVYKEWPDLAVTMRLPPRTDRLPITVFVRGTFSLLPGQSQASAYIDYLSDVVIAREMFANPSLSLYPRPSITLDSIDIAIGSNRIAAW